VQQHGHSVQSHGQTAWTVVTRVQSHESMTHSSVVFPIKTPTLQRWKPDVCPLSRVLVSKQSLQWWQSARV
jgi:hypothetical protein